MDHTTMQDNRTTDPSRFAPKRESKATGRHAGEVFGSVITLLALIVGLPAALIVLAGPPPIPTGVPALRDLVRQMSIEDVLTVLVAVLWITWLWFVVCVVAEVVAARRGGLAQRVPLAGPLQRLARVLIGALLLTGIAAGPAQAATPDQAPVSSTSASLVDAELPLVADPTPEVSESSQAGSKVYTVKAPVDGYHDNLWDIAENHLGDGRRYHEIYELNKDHVQSDGRKLELARLIQPGWTLTMPDDAVGVDRVPEPADVPVQAPTPVDDAPADVADTVQDSGDDAAFSSDLGRATGIGLLAAGVLAALALQRRRAPGRRPDDDARDVEGDLRVAATPDRAARLTAVLRRLPARCRAAGIAPPPVYGAIVDDESVELLIAPPMPEAVEAWAALDEGRRWRTTEGVDEASPADAVPYPALVGLGVDPDGRDVMVDLEAAGGVVAVTGDPGMAEEVVAAIAVQAATAPWSDAVRVTTADLPPAIAEVGDARLRVADLAAELDTIERQVADQTDDVLTGRMGRRGFVASHLIASGQVPEPDVAERLTVLARGRRQAFSVVMAGDHNTARWRMQVDAHGTLSVPQLDLTVTANRVNAAQVESVAELFMASRDPDRADAGDRVAVPVPMRGHDDSSWTTASRRVGVLGRVAVQVSGHDTGELAGERVDLATEMVTHLALHPEGVHPNVLAAVLWPRGVTADVRDGTIERVRAWLGTETDGSHALRVDAAGRLSLSEGVVCDWDCLRTLLLASRAAAAPREEIEFLRRALQMARGEAFADAPGGRYGWIARDDLPRTITRVVVDGAHRLAELLRDDPEGASAAAEAGLRVSPGDQSLWRSLLRSRYDENGVSGVRRTLDEMNDALAGLPIEAETEALVDELMPYTSSYATGS